MYRVIFLGTPEIAKVTLMEISKLKNIEIVAVYCQPDREYDRNKNIIFSPVKTFCIDNKIPFFQPDNINNSYDEIVNLKPDIIITCAYGQFISEKILNIPPYKCINFHASLLPKLRGGAPIHWAIINGETKTGISLMYMDKKMDAGNIIKQYVIDIDITDTYKSLYLKLCDLIKSIVSNDFYLLFDKNLKSFAQDLDKVTFGLNIKKEECFLDFNNLGLDIYNKIRGLNDKPVARALINKLELKIFESMLTDLKSTKLPGTIVDINKSGIQIATKDNDIKITRIQLPSKKIMLVSELINGNLPFKIGDCFSTFK